MLGSEDRLARLKQDMLNVIAAIRAEAGGRYACLLEPKGVVCEDPEPEDRESWALRRLLEERATDLFRIPEQMAAETPMEDAFAGWGHDELFLAFINRRVLLVVACPEAEPLREKARRPLAALADRLFRYNPAWRMDPQGRGFFFGHPKLDLIVIGRPEK